VAELIIMPKLGFNMSEGKLVKWYKKERDTVKKGEPLFCIETDKTNIDIEATGDGMVLKLLIGEGDSVPVTTPICVVGDDNDDVEAILSQGKTSSGESERKSDIQKLDLNRLNGNAPSVSREKTEGVRITPRARRIAAERGVLPEEWFDIPGTGFKGGICENDIILHLESKPQGIKVTPLARNVAKEAHLNLDKIEGSGFAGKIMADDVRKAVNGIPDSKSDRYETTEDGRVIGERLSYSGTRKIIGERLSMSASTAPHVYFTQKVNLEKLLDVRKQVNEISPVKVSVTDFIVRAVVLALQKYPNVNVSLDGDEILQFQSVNIGIAVAAPSGLIVPNIKGTERMSVLQIAEKASQLIEKARNGKLLPPEYTGGTFTVSNLGMFGIDNFTAIINPPEAAILAISATKDEPVVVVDGAGNKEVQIKPMMNIQLSADHRIIDGLLAAQFTAEIKNLLENPMGLVL
jgi:pyruvate dehydrogenase E2 component (dihydrolipoamide acetyltransferase)